MTRRIIASACAMLMVVAVALLAVFLNNPPANAASGSSAADPIIVASPSDVPASAVEDNPSTFGTANTCDTTRSWVNTTPGTSEVSHQEYRYKRDIPGQNQVSHQVYSYKKTVQDYKTQYYFAKYTHTKEKPRYGTWGAYGPWTKWSPETHTSWENSSAPLGVPAFHGEGTYSNGTQWYREWQAQWTGITRQVANGTHDEFSGERTTTLPAPWVLLPGYPKTVIDSASVPGYTEYYVVNAAPSRDVTKASWITSSTLAGWVKFEERKVVDKVATPAVVTYYAWSDNKVCDVVTPTPTPTPPPTSTPPPPTVKPKAGLDTRCTGMTYFYLNNKKSDVPVPFKLKGKNWSDTVTVPAHQFVTVTHKLPNKTRATVKVNGQKWTTVVPPVCPTPPPRTHTGKRQGA